jgi:hypothetical protein
MPVLCLQFQPKRAPTLSIGELAGLTSQIAFAVAGVSSVTIQRGRSASYFNVLIATRSVGRLWNRLRSELLQHRRLGSLVRASTIITAEGSLGWANYELMHHYGQESDEARRRLPNNRLQPTAASVNMMPPRLKRKR